MSADVGFTPGKLIEAAQSIQPIADPFSQSMAPLADEVTAATADLNGPFLEPLINALGTWGDSLEVLFNDLVTLGESLVDVECNFAACEEEIMQSLSQAATGDEAGGGDSSGGSLYDDLQGLGGHGAEGGTE